MPKYLVSLSKNGTSLGLVVEILVLTWIYGLDILLQISGFGIKANQDYTRTISGKTKSKLVLDQK